VFGSVITQTDQNLMVMQICEEVAAKHDLACLMQVGGSRTSTQPTLILEHVHTMSSTA